MILNLKVENMKDATGTIKRVLFAGLQTDIIGAEKITTVAELDDESGLTWEIDQLILAMLALKKKTVDVKKLRPVAKKKK